MLRVSEFWGQRQRHPSQDVLILAFWLMGLVSLLLSLLLDYVRDSCIWFLGKLGSESY